jgi:DNA polymerase III epsilon subunit-like protein
MGRYQMNLSARRGAILKAQKMVSRQPVYLDTETTGTGPNDNILEIAVIDHDGEVLVDTLVKPVGRIHPDALAVHGIRDEMVADAPRWGEVWDEIETALLGRLAGIYNADFDLRMMKQSHARNWMTWTQPKGMDVFCIMKLYAQFYGQWNSRRGNYRWQSLDAAGRQCGIPLPNSHRALDDTLLTRAILRYMAGGSV